MSEALFRKRIQDFSKHCNYPSHWQSIESSATGQGIPDLNGCYAGIDVWIETKYTEHHRTKNIGLKPMQIAWLYKRAKAGGNVWIALYMKSKMRNVGFIYIWHGKDVRKVNELGTFFPPFRLLRVEKLKDWEDFYETIFKQLDNV